MTYLQRLNLLALRIDGICVDDQRTVTVEPEDAEAIRSAMRVAWTLTDAEGLGDFVSAVRQAVMLGSVPVPRLAASDERS